MWQDNKKGEKMPKLVDETMSKNTKFDAGLDLYLMAESDTLPGLERLVSKAINENDCFTIGYTIITVNDEGEVVYRQRLVRV